jgi:hypothetical protein
VEMAQEERDQIRCCRQAEQGFADQETGVSWLPGVERYFGGRRLLANSVSVETTALFVSILTSCVPTSDVVSASVAERGGEREAEGGREGGSSDSSDTYCFRRVAGCQRHRKRSRRGEAEAGWRLSLADDG